MLQPRIHNTHLPFDDINDLPGETVLFDARDREREGEAVADVADSACVQGVVPVQIVVTNYRLKLYEPTKEGATIEVTLCGATDLKAADLNGLSDPYAVVSLTGCNHRSFRCPKKTRALEKTLNPTWNETFIFAGVDEGAMLRVELFDSDKHSKDDALGEVTVQDIAQWDGGETKTWSLCLPVTEGGMPGEGLVQLRLRRLWLAHDVDVRHNSIPLMSIEAAKLDEKNNSIEIHTKCPRLLRLFFDDGGTARQVARVLNEAPDAAENFFCMAGDAAPSREYVFSWEDMLMRLTAEEGHGLRGHRGEDAAAYRARWQCDAEVNAGYAMCETYPDKVLLPSALPREALEASAKFRTKHRFPCVAWLHPGNGAMLVRCSQPMTAFSAGLTGQFIKNLAGRSGEAKGDWDCLQHFAVPGHDGRLTICDCRPWLNAEANRMKGGGTEYDMGVKGFHMEFLDIGNIHDMRGSIEKLREGVCQQADFAMSYSSIGNWLAHLHGVISGAAYVADVIESGETVIVHCSDGWDRTSQIVSLASLLLDGHYRTIAGFPELIEKDWLKLGHKFADRNGLKSKQEQVKGHDETSPIFLQFIDCIAQIMHMFPHFFEYNVDFLAFVLYHSFSARFGNFLGNCEKQRSDTRPCLWSELLRDAERWRNPLYDPSSNQSPLSPCSVPMQQMTFQHELYAMQCRMWPRESSASKAPRRSQPEGEDLEGSIYHRKSGPGVGSQGLDQSKRSMGPSGQSAAGEPMRTLKNFAAEADAELPRVGALSRDLQEAEDFLRRFLALPEFLSGEPHVQVKEQRALADHIEYVLLTNAGPSSYEVTRRYSQFQELFKALHAYPRLKIATVFPSKTLFPAGSKTLEARVIGLSTWIQEVVTLLVREEHSFFSKQAQAAPAAEPV